MKITIIGLTIVILAVVAGLVLHAQAPASGTVGQPFLLPNVIPENKPTTVTIVASIGSTLLVPGSVNVLRLSSQSSTPVVLGQMHDDGQNGDAVAGDGVYTYRTVFSESSPTTIRLRISAAFRGSLKRALSPVINLAVTPDGTLPLPPDPGAAGNTTLGGIDRDGDGVRDDVQRYIALNYASAKQRAALTQLALAIETEILNSTDATVSKSNARQTSYAGECLDPSFMTSGGDVKGGWAALHASQALQALIANTPARAEAFVQADSSIHVSFEKATQFVQEARYCLIDPTTLPQ